VPVSGEEVISPPERAQFQLLARCHTNCISLASSKNTSSMDFPAISTGAYGFPIRRRWAGPSDNWATGQAKSEARDLRGAEHRHAEQAVVLRTPLAKSTMWRETSRSGETIIAAPRSMASRGIPKTTQLASS